MLLGYLVTSINTRTKLICDKNHEHLFKQMVAEDKSDSPLSAITDNNQTEQMGDAVHTHDGTAEGPDTVRCGPLTIGETYGATKPRRSCFQE